MKQLSLFITLLVMAAINLHAQDRHNFEHPNRHPYPFLPPEAYSGCFGFDGSETNTPSRSGTPNAGIPTVHLPENLTIHFISPEPIQYVDISTKAIEGDLPLKNILRIRAKDNVKGFDDAVITIAGEKFVAQYHIVPGGQNVPTEINIEPSDMKQLDIAGIGLSQPQLKSIALGLFCKRPGAVVEHAKAFGIAGTVNHIYTVGDYFFIDLGYENKTNLVYDIDEFRFKIEDKKVTKASNIQSIEIKPEFVLFDKPSFKKYYRNIFVFRKMSFPGNKILHIELSEKQLSGRVIKLNLTYRDILNADIVCL